MTCSTCNDTGMIDQGEPCIACHPEEWEQQKDQAREDAIASGYDEGIR